jgi:hypothetical protein
MLQALQSYRDSNLHFLWTGDESRMSYEYHRETSWACSWEEVYELQRPTHYYWKTTVTGFFNGRGLDSAPGFPDAHHQYDHVFFRWSFPGGSEGPEIPKIHSLSFQDQSPSFWIRMPPGDSSFCRTQIRPPINKSDSNLDSFMIYLRPKAAACSRACLGHL